MTWPCLLHHGLVFLSPFRTPPTSLCVLCTSVFCSFVSPAFRWHELEYPLSLKSFLQPNIWAGFYIVADLVYEKDHISGSSLKSWRPPWNGNLVSAKLLYRYRQEGQKSRWLQRTCPEFPLSLSSRMWTLGRSQVVSFRLLLSGGTHVPLHFEHPSCVGKVS